MPSSAATRVETTPRERVTPGTTRADRVPVPPDLDALLQTGPAVLAQLYRDARVPVLAEVTGDLRGRLLAIPMLTEPVAGLPRLLASTRWFPWRGKSFRAPRDARGAGINRVLIDRFRLFRFETFLGRSRAGDFDALQLDYDNADNPFFIRAIKDEIRQLAPGLFLGQAYVQIGGSRPRLALYFGLTTHPAAAMA